MNNSAPYFKIETFGTLDGPGTRLVIFLQGCILRCLYCHNPESWTLKSSMRITPEEVIQLYLKNHKFYQNDGGITMSGGEPLIHQDFCLTLAKLCKKQKINLALDTSGATFSKSNLSFYKKLIKHKPLWIVDIKQMNLKKHKQITGANNLNELSLIKFLDKNKQKYWVRYVLVPNNYTNSYEDLNSLAHFLKSLKCMDRFELLPYHRLGLQKYKQLHIKNNLIGVKEPTKEEINWAKKIIIEPSKIRQ